MSKPPYSLGRECLAEFLCAFILILVGDGAVAVAVFTGGLDSTGVALLWGLAVMFAIYSFGYISGGHFNPAVTIALAVGGEFPIGKVVPYIASQVAGASAAAAVIYGMWAGFWQPAAGKLGVQIGEAGSQKLAAVFMCFYPAPGVGVGPEDWQKVSALGCFAVEVVITALLLVMVSAVGNPSNTNVPGVNLAPVFIGLTVTAFVAFAGPLTMACANPARDLGPRIVAFFVGFGDIAFPGPRGNEWWLYWAGPVTGGILGKTLYRLARG